MNITIYKLKKWQRKIPKWLYPLFRINPSIKCYNCRLINPSFKYEDIPIPFTIPISFTMAGENNENKKESF